MFGKYSRIPGNGGNLLVHPVQGIRGRYGHRGGMGKGILPTEFGWLLLTILQKYRQFFAQSHNQRIGRLFVL